MDMRKLKSLLKEEGYEEIHRRGKGGHRGFFKDGCEPIFLPTGKNVSPGLLKDVFRKTGLEIDPDTGKVTRHTPERRLHLPPGAPLP